MICIAVLKILYNEGEDIYFQHAQAFAIGISQNELRRNLIVDLNDPMFVEMFGNKPFRGLNYTVGDNF